MKRNLFLILALASLCGCSMDGMMDKPAQEDVATATDVSAAPSKDAADPINDPARVAAAILVQSEWKVLTADTHFTEDGRDWVTNVLIQKVGDPQVRHRLLSSGNDREESGLDLYYPFLSVCRPGDVIGWEPTSKSTDPGEAVPHIHTYAPDMPVGTLNLVSAPHLIRAAP